MGLKKHVQLPNGVQLNYHRVASVSIVTNAQNVIEVASYTSQAKRREEKAMTAALAAGDGGASCDVFVDTSLHAAPYDPAMTVEGAYEWLKSTEEVGGEPNPLFGAEDAQAGPGGAEGGE